MGLGLALFVAAASRGAPAASSTFAAHVAELDDLASREGAANAAAEITQTRGWIGEGEGLQRRGKLRRAAVVRERIGAQLELVRVLVATGEVLAEAERAERENLELTREIEVLRARRTRLEMGAEGARATRAYPPREKGGR
jgi:hypothetical protein